MLKPQNDLNCSQKTIALFPLVPAWFLTEQEKEGTGVDVFGL